MSYLLLTASAAVPCGDPRTLPVQRFSVLVFHVFGTVLERRVKLNNGQGKVTDLIIKTESADFNLLMLYFQKVPLLDNLIVYW